MTLGRFSVSPPHNPFSSETEAPNQRFLVWGLLFLLQKGGDVEPSPVYYNVFMVEIPIRQMGSFPSCCLSC